MDIEPSESTSQNVEHYPQAPLQESIQAEATDSDITLCYQHLDEEKKKRIELLNSEPQKNIVFKIEQGIGQLAHFVRQYKEITEDSSYPNKDIELKKISDAYNKEVELIGELGKSLGFDTMYLSIPISEVSPEEFEYRGHMATNSFINSLIYKQEVENILSRNESIIVETFFSNTIGENLSATLGEDLGGDPHLQGKKPMIVVLRYGSEERKLVYKPRNAMVDRSVIEVFRSVNKLPIEDKSGTHDLPVYEILSLEDGDASLWEFVEGDKLESNKMRPKYLRKPIPAGQYLKSQFVKAPKKQKLLQEKLNRMDTILSAMHISDLHGENVLIRGEKTKDPTFVPIDLENIQTQEKAESQLGGKPSPELLTDKERELITQFNASIHGIAFRYLPMPTQTLAQNARDPNNSENLAEGILKVMSEEGINATVHCGHLKRCITIDILNRDIPYFTELGGVIYYGSPDQKLVIGERLGKLYPKFDLDQALKSFLLESVSSSGSMQLQKLSKSLRRLMDKAQTNTVTMNEILVFQDEVTRVGPSVSDTERKKYDEIVENIQVLIVTLLAAQAPESASSVDPDITFTRDGQEYTVRHTFGDGACAIHALLGENENGIFRFSGYKSPKKQYTDELQSQLHNSNIQGYFINALTGYFTVENDRCADMLFKDSEKGKMLKAKWVEIDQRYTHNINQNKAEEGKLWLPYAAEGNPVLTKIMENIKEKSQGSPWHNKGKEEVIAMVTENPALLTDLISEEPEAYLDLLKEAADPIRGLREKREAINQEMEEAKRAFILSPDVVNHYVATANNPAFYLNTDDIRIAAHLFGKQVQIVASREGGVEPASEPINPMALGDLVVIHHQGAHFSRCVKKEGSS